MASKIIEEREITPEVARRMLSVQTRNRSVKRDSLLRMSEDMRAGRWREDLCPPIILGLGGEVIDGQHRLTAVCLSGVTVRFLIRVVGEKDGYGLPIDIGCERRPKDLLLCNKRVAEIVNVCSFISSGRVKVSANDLLFWDRIIGGTASRLVAQHGGTVRTMSVAGVKTGFCVVAMSMSDVYSEEHVFRAYSDLKSAKLESTSPPSIPALYRWLLGKDGKMSGSSGTIFRCWAVLEAFARPSATLIRAPESNKATEDLRAVLSRIAEKHRDERD